MLFYIYIYILYICIYIYNLEIRGTKETANGYSGDPATNMRLEFKFK